MPKEKERKERAALRGHRENERLKGRRKKAYSRGQAKGNHMRKKMIFVSKARTEEKKKDILGVVIKESLLNMLFILHRVQHYYRTGFQDGLRGYEGACEYSAACRGQNPCSYQLTRGLSNEFMQCLGCQSLVVSLDGTVPFGVSASRTSWSWRVSGRAFSRSIFRSSLLVSLSLYVDKKAAVT